MKTEENITLRKQIREILLNADELKDFDSLRKQKNFKELKKDCYDKLIDLKNQFETVEEVPNNSDSIRKIGDLIMSLEKIKKQLGNQID
jgi:hypothetical protein